MRCMAASALLCLAVACQKPAASSGAGGAYARDIDRICHAEEHSGAAELPEGGRSLHIAQWLATSLESQEARALSAELSQMELPERARRLSAEAAKLGMSDCAMLAAWGADTAISSR